MRATRAHRDNRRSHHALKGASLSVCKNCGEKFKSHTVCNTCGFYNGREVIDMKKEAVKKAKKTKESQTAR